MIVYNMDVARTIAGSLLSLTTLTLGKALINAITNLDVFS